MTEWCLLRGYSRYLVSNEGVVVSINYKNTGKIKEIRQSMSKDGYKTISLCKNNKLKTYRVHRLVAECFVENPHNLETVDHIDGDKNNNRADNLQWLSSRENNQKYHKAVGHNTYPVGYWNKHGNHVQKHRSHIPVKQFTKDGCFIAEYSSITDASNKTKINSGGICNCISGRKKSAGGYIWEKTGKMW